MHVFVTTFDVQDEPAMILLGGFFHNFENTVFLRETGFCQTFIYFHVYLESNSKLIVSPEMASHKLSETL